MAKFLNKKEQVLDFQLTPYGKQKLALGSFKPTYYSFFDEGIIYDGKYANLDPEKQNDIHKRIKDNTTFLEGVLSFTELENSVLPSYYVGADGTDVTDITVLRTALEDAGYSESMLETTVQTWTDMITGELDSDMKFAFAAHDLNVRPDQLTFQSEIGDAHFNSQNQQSAPAWKLVSCQGLITSSAPRDTTVYSPRTEKQTGSLEIPQINVELYYTKRVGKPTSDIASTRVSNTINTSKAFMDGNVIELIRNDMVIYAEEVNTEMLTDNFEIEVFQITEDTKTATTDSTTLWEGKETTLKRKYFEKDDPQVVDGFMRRPRPQKPLDGATTTLTDNSVEYFFDVLTDSEVYPKLACACAETFNKESYYIDLDFKCEEEPEALFYDIYGSVTVPEICDTTSTDFPVTTGQPTTDTTECEDE